MAGDKHREKDRWDKWDIVLRPVGGILTALAVAGVGFFGSQYLESRQAADTNVRLYAQLMSSREKADSDLRKEMFNSIITAFLNPDTESEKRDLEDEILALELLAYNFHDVIDLGPLFKHVERTIAALQARPDADATASRERALEKRLQSVALEVISKQLATLKEGGIVRQRSIAFADLEKQPQGVVLLNQEPLQLDNDGSAAADGESTRYFNVEAQDHDPVRKRIRIRLQIRDSVSTADSIDVVFWVGYFDFPMIDNTRLPGGRRAAVVLTDWWESSAEVALVYFPGSRASLKEKPYYDEVLDELVRAGKVLGRPD